MSAVPSDYSLRRTTRRLGDRIGDVAMRVITLLAALAAVVLLGAIVWTAALIASHQAIAPVLGEHDARGLAAGAVLAAIVAVGVPRMAGPR